MRFTLFFHHHFPRLIQLTTKCAAVRQLIILLFGILIGILFGVCLNFDEHSHVDTDGYHVSSKLRQKSNGSIGALQIVTAQVYLQCLIIIQPATYKPEKFLSAIIDSYSTQCNETLFFTNSKGLVEKFAEVADIYLISTIIEPSEWPFIQAVLQFVSTRNAKLPDSLDVWSAILNERAFLITENLRRFIVEQRSTNTANADGDNPKTDYAIIGRVIDVRASSTLVNVMSHFFPMGEAQLRSFALESGLFLSRAATQKMILASSSTARFCEDGIASWFHPKHSGKALFKCAFNLGVTIWDPIDEDGHHLLVPVNLRTIFSNPHVSLLSLFERHQTKNLKFSAAGEAKTDVAKSNSELQLAACCSDNAISFGMLTYQDMRVLDFAINNLRVFGI